MSRNTCRALLVGTLGFACTRAVPEVRPTKEPAVGTVSAAPASPPPLPAPPSPAATEEAAPHAGTVDERFAAELRTIFSSYKAWGRVDDELRWAPFLCRMPEPGRPAMSAAQDGGHARKLYSLFAKNRNAYIGIRGADARPPTTIGQVIVKESYLPEVVSLDAPTAPMPHGGIVSDGGPGEADHFHPYVTEKGTTYRAATLAGLYVMLRKEPRTPGTDDGWVYGTSNPNGELTSAGRVSSCMSCHTTRPGRLFGRHRS